MAKSLNKMKNVWYSMPNKTVLQRPFCERSAIPLNFVQYILWEQELIQFTKFGGGAMVACWMWRVLLGAGWNTSLIWIMSFSQIWISFFMMRKRHALAKIPDGRHRGSIQNERVPCISRSQDRSDLIIISTRILLHQDYSVITLSTAEITSSVMGTGQ